MMDQGKCRLVDEVWRDSWGLPTAVRYHHRLSTPQVISNPYHCGRSTDHSRTIGIRDPAGIVTAHNNPYSTNTASSDINHATFSIFGDRVMTVHDISILMDLYERIMADTGADERYGPFDQMNLNLAGVARYNYKAKLLRPSPNKQVVAFSQARSQQYQVFHLAFQGATEFVKALNRSFWQMQSGDLPSFHLADHRIYKIDRSSVTGYLRVTLIVGVSKNIHSKVFYFLLDIYMDPSSQKQPPILGNARFIGDSTTDKVLLLQGQDNHSISPGRPLHSFYAERSRMPSMQEVKSQFLQKINRS